MTKATKSKAKPAAKVEADTPKVPAAPVAVPKAPEAPVEVAVEETGELGNPGTVSLNDDKISDLKLSRTVEVGDKRYEKGTPINDVAGLTANILLKLRSADAVA